MTKELLEWSRRRENGNPRCVEDLDEVQFADIMGSIAETHHLDRVVDTAFVGTEEADAERVPIDAIDEEKDRAMQDNADAYDDEQDLLERIPLPGDPTSERDRKMKWLALPRRARIAIRRLHRNFRHLPRNALLQMLRAARVPKEYIDAAKVHKCDVCTATKPPAPLKKVSPPKPYTFNHEVGVDVFEIKDAAGTFYDILNIVDYGTTLQQAGIVRVGDNNGVPSSSSCLEYFHKGWVRCYGWPKFVAVDRGTHNRGVFAQTSVSYTHLTLPTILLV